MAKPPLIPPMQRHDAPDPDRPYMVLSPLVPLALAVTLAAVALLFLTFNALAVLAALTGLCAAVSNTPRLLRAPTLTRLERRMMRSAQRRRDRRGRRWQRLDRTLIVSWQSVEVMFGCGALVLLASAPVALFSATGGTVARAGLGLAGLALLLAFALSGVTVLYAQLKGDVATGPMRFYKAAALAHWMERHPDRTDDIQFWSLALTFIFAAGAFAAEAAG